MSNEANQHEPVKDNPVEDPTTQTVHDPVCHMDIVAEDAAGNSEYNGFTYYFCSDHCKDAFDSDPDAVLLAEAEHNHDEPLGHHSADLQKEEPSGALATAQDPATPQSLPIDLPEPVAAGPIDESGLANTSTQLLTSNPSRGPGLEAGANGHFHSSVDDYSTPNKSREKSQAEKVKREAGQIATSVAERASEAGRTALKILRKRPLLAPLIIVGLGVLTKLTLRKGNK